MLQDIFCYRKSQAGRAVKAQDEISGSRQFTTEVVSGIITILTFPLYLDQNGSDVSLDGAQPMPASSQCKMIVT
jgi:hypothetical protein